MGRAHSFLAEIEGNSFYKLMGSGAGNGFSIWPDWSVYCLLMVWEDRVYMEDFFERNAWWKKYKGKSEKHFRLELQCVQSKGSWDGVSLFTEQKDIEEGGKIVVLTRATIKKRYIPLFWSKVPIASKPVPDLEGNEFSKGVGEVPLLHQATVSVWKSKEYMHRYAYQNEAHTKMIRMTREKGWYAEEMFAEFKLIKTVGEMW